MSIFSKIVRGITGAAAGFLAGGPVGAVIGGAGAFLPQKRAPSAAAFAPAAAAPSPFLTGSLPGFATPVRGMRLPSIPRIPGLPPALPGLPIPLPGFGGDAAGGCPVGFHLDKKTRTRCVRNRRMNVLNGRAAMRAIRRVKGARKMLQKIERQLPRAKARRTPAHGHRTTVKTL